MEPAEDRPDDMERRGQRRDGDAAAMEPAEDRPDDAGAMPSGLPPTDEPQWSRPKIGRMTTTSPGLMPASSAPPQWSRPKIGRMTYQCPQC